MAPFADQRGWPDGAERVAAHRGRGSPAGSPSHVAAIVLVVAAVALWQFVALRHRKTSRWRTSARPAARAGDFEPRRRAHRARQRDLGAGRRLGRHAAAGRRFVQPVAQFLAAFPANLLFPIAVSAIVALKLNPDIWLSPLMILGTQWYILFNVVAGASGDSRRAARGGANFRVRGWLWWRRIALPAVLPYYVTGAITASGGSWNASIVAEVAAGATCTSRRRASAPILRSRRRPATSTVSCWVSR